MIPSPVPAYNFDPVPTVTRVDDFWYRKYGETKDGKLVRIAETEDVAQKRSTASDVHLPSPSYWPIVAGLRPADRRLRPASSACGCACSAASIVVGGIYGWVARAAGRPRRAHATTVPTTTPPTTSCRGDRRRAGEPPTPSRRRRPTEAEKEAETVG